MTDSAPSHVSGQCTNYGRDQTISAARHYFHLAWRYMSASNLIITPRRRAFKFADSLRRRLVSDWSLFIGRVDRRNQEAQVWGHTPEQRIAASTLRRYSFGLRLAIAQADARPVMPVSLRWDSI